MAEYFLAPVEDIANKEKKIPASWIKDSTRLTDQFRDYLRPLVSCETHVSYTDGVFDTANLKLEKVG